LRAFSRFIKPVALLLETSFGSITTILKTTLEHGEDNELSLRLRRSLVKVQDEKDFYTFEKQNMLQEKK
jgi:hypothetical protein